MDNPDVVMFGLMSSMRTGNMILDMAICLMLPFMFRVLWQHLNQKLAQLNQWFVKKMNREYRRTIDHTRSNRPWNETKSSHKNRVLITALRQYIGREVNPVYPSGDIKLQAVTSKGDGDSDDGSTLVKQLEKKYHLVCVPPKDEPVEVAPGLFFRDSIRMNRAEEDGKKSSSMSLTSTLIFTTNLSGGRERVDTFIKKAYSWYVKEIESHEDTSYFMYQPLVSRGSSDDKTKGTTYKRY